MIRRVLFDLDGVLTDFESVAPKLDNGKVDWNKVKTLGRDFWKNMPWLEEGKKLITEVMNLGIKVGILSSIFLPAGIVGKKEWIKKNLPMIDEIDVVIVRTGSQKPSAAGPNDLLIDDQLRSVELFNARYSGNGILYTGFETTLQKIKDKLNG